LLFNDKSATYYTFTAFLECGYPQLSSHLRLFHRRIWWVDNSRYPTPHEPNFILCQFHLIQAST